MNDAAIAATSPGTGRTADAPTLRFIVPARTVIQIDRRCHSTVSTNRCSYGYARIPWMLFVVRRLAAWYGGESEALTAKEPTMRWEGQRESENVEDRRGFGPVGTGTGIGLGGLVLILAVSFLTGTNPLTLLNLVETVQEGSAPPAAESSAPTGPPTDTLGRFAAVVLANTEDTWKAVLPELGRRYEEPRLVLFTGAVRSACGFSSSAVGPFYCSMDRKVYLDLSFFKELADRFGAPGDFAQAYVIAHEVGHHVQNLIGIADRVARLQRRASEREANALSVRMELQADCLAGVWGYHAKEDKLIEPGDFEDGLRAASAIGDDRLQRLSQGYVQPESWTHGSSEQRSTWLRRGLQSGDPARCDTFDGAASGAL
jgi:predicted metalloprotease